MRTIALRLLVVWMLLALSLGAWAADSDRAQMLAGVREIASPGIPGGVAVFGPQAFPLVVGKADDGTMAAVIAASTLGKGRIVAFGHDGYFGKDALTVGDTARLLLNATHWAAGGKASPRLGVVALPDTLAFFQSRGLAARAVRPGDDWGRYDVLVITHDGMTPDAQSRLRAFVRAGGGLLAASTGWGWQQITGRAITEHPGTQITLAAGLAWTDQMLGRTSPQGLDATTAPSPLLNVGAALNALSDGAATQPAAPQAQAVAIVLSAVRCLPASDTLLRPRLRALRGRVGAVVPTPEHPVTNQQPLERLALSLDLTDAMNAPAAQVKAHPAARAFPGDVPPGTPRVTRALTLDMAVPDWHSTGLYAAPGAVVTVTVPAEAVKKGLAVRIGAHTDALWHLDKWQRAPAITRSFPITQTMTQAANAFGGPIYIAVPDGKESDKIPVLISGAVEAPLFVLDQTTPAEWRTSLRARPAPWAEMAGHNVIFSVPSDLVRAIEDPAPLMQLWDRIVAAQDRLADLPPRRRPERIVADRQISAGYMHSGYPIMTPIDDTTRLAMSEPRLRTEGSWGHFHELGHNHQSPDWTFDGTGEVTNNVYDLYVYAKVLGLPFDSGHPAIRDRTVRMARVRKYIEAGAPFDQWKKDPFLALTMYIQLIEGFGWTPFERVFAEYRHLSDAERPHTDDQKRDQWLTRFSRTVGRDLGPFFQAWGVPTSDTARASLHDLPPWMPADMPRREKPQG